MHKLNRRLEKDIEPSDKRRCLWALLHGEDSTGSFNSMLGLVPLDVEIANGDVQIRVAGQFPPDTNLSENQFE